MIKRVLILAIIGLFIFLGVKLSTQFYESLQASKRLDLEVEKVAQIQKRNEELKKTLAEVQSTAFLETQARNKLNYSRNGETVVVIPQSEIDKVLQAQIKPTEVKVPNWQGWLNLFIN